MVDEVGSNPDNIVKFELDDTPMMNRILEGVRMNSALLQRVEWMSRAGIRFDQQRDMYNVFGYLKVLKQEDFWTKYIRQDIASRVVDAPPDAVWSNPPSVTFGGRNKDAKWDRLLNGLDFWGGLNQADKFNRLGTFSLLLFGFDDRNPLESPVGRASKVNYLRAIPSRQVTEVKLNSDIRSPRFGKPEMYTISFADPKQRTINQGTSITTELRDIKVHASRCIHIVEYPLEDEVTGVPVMERVFNLLDDLLKVSGGTSETYWLTANRGMQVDVDKEMDLNPDDMDALEDELQEFQHQLRRYIRTRGVKINSLGSDTPSPQQTFEMIMALISGTTGIPRRILMGSEAGQLASEQDRANWAERIGERRVLFAEPRVLRPAIKLCQEAGVLTPGEVTIEWPEAFILSPLERAQTMAQTARAIGNISRQTGNKQPMQLVSRDEGREILGYKTPLPDKDIYASDPLLMSEEDAAATLGISPGGPEGDGNPEDEDEEDNNRPPPSDQE